MNPPHYQDATVTLHAGNCLDVLAELPDASIDAVVCDPPYGLANTTPQQVADTIVRWVNGDRDYIPTGSGFMGRAWDAFVPPVAVWDECLRVLKPGGHALVFAGTRTMDLMTLGLRLAGFDIRDSIAWLYGSGFPKSLDVSKAIDKRRDWSLVERLSGEIRRARAESGLSLAEIGQATLAATDGTYGKWYHRGGHMFFETGRSLPSRPEWDQLRHVLPIAPKFAEVYDEAEREVVGVQRGAMSGWNMDGTTRFVDRDITAPATPDAEQWQGWGTALKPAFEPVVVARKPLVGTVAGNVLAWGTGALNIDGCRVEHDEPAGKPSTGMHGRRAGIMGETIERHRETTSASTAGRWPANVALDESQADALDQQSGVTSSKRSAGRNGADVAEATWGLNRADDLERGHDDSGGASRFFFIAREDNEPCPNHDPANGAGSSSSPPSASGDSVPANAATSASHDTARPTGSPSTNGTPSASRPSGETSTPTTTSTAGESSHDWQPAKPSQMVSPARYAASLSRTDTTTTTTSPSTSDGFADPTTSSTTPNSVPGVPLDELGSRFTYVAKADASERVRVNGTAHPTVKPLALMRWLVRLVTPPGGTILEPFAGSGTTVEAAILEGFHCVAIERETDYLPLIQQRIHRRRDPVQAVKGAGEDGGLFDLLNDEESA